MKWIPPYIDPSRKLRDLLPRAGWQRAIEEICSRHGIDFSQPTPFATGSDAVWSVGNCVVKLTAPAWSRQIEAEAHCLLRVRNRLSVRTPAPIATGELGGWPYIVLSRIAGVGIGVIWPQLERSERVRLAGALGRLTRELHALEVTDETDQWDGFWNECRAGVAKRSEVGLPDNLAAEVTPYLESTGELNCEPRVLLHTELLDQHVLVEERQGRYELCGLIDFADSRVGPAEYDFPAPAEFIFRGERGLMRSFLLAYGYSPEELTPECSERILAWGLSHRYGSLSRMLRAVEPARPQTLSALARNLYDVTPTSET